MDMKPDSPNSTDRINPLVELNPVIHAHARLMIMTYLYVLQSADYIFLMKMTSLTWGNLASHLSKLENAGYIRIEKGFEGKKPHTMLSLSDAGRVAFRNYKKNLKQVLDELPDY